MGTQWLCIDTSSAWHARCRRPTSDRTGLHPQRNASWSIVLGLSYRTLGIIYGDIATSPLYLWPSVFSSAPAEKDVLGALCLLFWTLTLVNPRLFTNLC